MATMFKRATRQNLNVRLALCGSTGSGKTYSALGIATVLAEGGQIAVIDTERSSADRYADKFTFDTCPLDTFSPEAYTEAIEGAKRAGYRVLVLDSFSHAWDGAEGMLERVDNIAKRSKSGNSFQAWGEGTPLYRRLVDEILKYPGHVIVTMRSKTEYVLEENDRGKKVPRKVGMAPVQRAGIEYEFDLVGEMDSEHNIVMTKSRAESLADKVVNRPGRRFALEILAWAKGASAATPAPQAATLSLAETAARAAEVVQTIEQAQSDAPQAPTPPSEAPADHAPPAAEAHASAPQVAVEQNPRLVEELTQKLNGAGDKAALLRVAAEIKSAVDQRRVGDDARTKLLSLYSQRSALMKSSRAA